LACLDLQSYIRNLTVHFGSVNMKIKLSMWIFFIFFWVLKAHNACFIENLIIKLYANKRLSNFFEEVGIQNLINSVMFIITWLTWSYSAKPD
jgi:hypothetical protein